MSPINRALALSASLSDAKQPLACPTCSCVIAYRLQPTTEQGSRLLEDLRDNHAEFWDSCITFVTASRTEDGLPALRQKLLQNISICKYRAEHNTIMRSNFTDVVHTLVESLYMALLACLTRGRHSMMNRPKAPKGFGTRHGRWPETAEKLFPFAEDQCVDMHGFWSSLRFSSAPFAVLSCTLSVARPMVLPHICAGTGRARLLYILAQMLRADVTTIPDGWEGELPVHPAGGAAFPLALSKERTSLLETSTSFLEILSGGLDSKACDWFEFFTGYELAMFRAIQAASRGVDATTPTFIALSHFAYFLHSKLGLPYSALDARVRAVCPDAAETDTRASESEAQKQMPQVTLLHLIQLRKQRGCSAPGCTKNVHDNGGKPLATCSKCKTVRYCGRDCQQRDWKSGAIKHKVICPILCRLLAEASADMRFDDFAPVFERVLGIEERMAVFQWAASSGLLFTEGSTRNINRGFRALNEFKDYIFNQPAEVQDEFIREFEDLLSGPPAIRALPPD
ncbi:hypothetical protein AURDEDRAFT_112882 [Auricularia subglabra TFB-10046 SS5]|nr:hypothetical protein AURDEDRAFT_112882 [Auricularia subglabra TFB-10046 SS5]